MIRVESELTSISALGQKVAKTHAPKDTGLGINSIQIIREFRPPVFVGGIETNLPYMVVMEEGRKPGTMPPIAPLIRWVRRHRATFAIGTGKGARAKTKGIAFAIATKIKKKGIPSNLRFDKRGFFKKAEKAIELRFGKSIDNLGLQIQTAWESGG